MWQSEVDTKLAAEKRIRFLAEFKETLFQEVCVMYIHYTVYVWSMYVHTYVMYINIFMSNCLSCQALSLEKSPARKNNILANALQLKSEKANNPADALKLLSQALCFATEENKDQIIRRRSEKCEELK